MLLVGRSIQALGATFTHTQTPFIMFPPENVEWQWECSVL